MVRRDNSPMMGSWGDAMCGAQSATAWRASRSFNMISDELGTNNAYATTTWTIHCRDISKIFGHRDHPCKTNELISSFRLWHGR